MEKMFVYILSTPENPKQHSFVAEADSVWVEQFITRKELILVAKQIHVFPFADNTDAQEYQEFIGLKGKRKIARLKRVLIERGAQFEVVTTQTWDERMRKLKMGARLLAKTIENNTIGKTAIQNQGFGVVENQ